MTIKKNITYKIYTLLQKILLLKRLTPRPLQVVGFCLNVFLIACIKKLNLIVKKFNVYRPTTFRLGGGVNMSSLSLSTKVGNPTSQIIVNNWTCTLSLALYLVYSTHRPPVILLQRSTTNSPDKVMNAEIVLWRIYWFSTICYALQGWNSSILKHNLCQIVVAYF